MDVISHIVVPSNLHDLPKHVRSDNINNHEINFLNKCLLNVWLSNQADLNCLWAKSETPVSRMIIYIHGTHVFVLFFRYMLILQFETVYYLFLNLYYKKI